MCRVAANPLASIQHNRRQSRMCVHGLRHILGQQFVASSQENSLPSSSYVELAYCVRLTSMPIVACRVNYYS